MDTPPVAPIPAPAVEAARATLQKQLPTSSQPRFSLHAFGLEKDRMLFIQNLAILLNAGLPVVDALTIIHQDTANKRMKLITELILKDVRSGVPLWQSLRRQNFLSNYAMALVRVGEEAGALAPNLKRLAQQQEKDRALKQKVKTAMLYPTIVFFITIGVMFILATFVLPQLVGVLQSLNVPLPFSTRAIIWIAGFFTAYWLIILPAIVFGSIGIFLLCRFTRLRGPAQSTLFHLPGFGPMGRHATIARSCMILGGLLQAGLPPVEAMRHLSEMLDIIAYQRFFAKLAAKIEVGQSFANSFADMPETTKLLTLPAQQLIVTGERSGQIADMLMQISDMYEKKAEESAQKLPIVLEPLLLVFIASLVGIIAFSILIPIYSIVGGIGDA